jgi:hypothetical protein
MPLFVCLADEHYLDRDGHPRADYFVVLSGGLEVGGFHRIAGGPSEGRWSWLCGIGSGDPTFAASGYAAHPDVCRTLIGLSFRRMLARADLREQPDAKPGPPRFGPVELTATPAPPYDRTTDPEGGPRSELRKAVRSGELVVGVLSRDAYGPERWSWFVSGLPRPDDADFRWYGEAASELEAFVALSTCWQRWTRWAGLEPIAELERGLKR